MPTNHPVSLSEIFRSNHPWRERKSRKKTANVLERSISVASNLSVLERGVLLMGPTIDRVQAWLETPSGAFSQLHTDWHEDWTSIWFSTPTAHPIWCVHWRVLTLLWNISFWIIDSSGTLKSAQCYSSFARHLWYCLSICVFSDFFQFHSCFTDISTIKYRKNVSCCNSAAWGLLYT